MCCAYVLCDSLATGLPKGLQEQQELCGGSGPGRIVSRMNSPMVKAKGWVAARRWRPRETAANYSSNKTRNCP